MGGELGAFHCYSFFWYVKFYAVKDFIFWYYTSFIIRIVPCFLFLFLIFHVIFLGITLFVAP